MGLSGFYGPAMEQRAAINLSQEAVDLSKKHFDTAIEESVAAMATLVAEGKVGAKGRRYRFV